jgi:hypothetical protein
MQQEEKNKINLLSPAFPPQVAQDSLGRIFAAIPGMTKLEFFSIMMFPALFDHYTSINNDDDDERHYNKEEIFDLTITHAQNFLNLLNEQNEKDSTTIIK